MFPQTCSQSFSAKVAQHHPQFERAEAATERDAVCHEIGRLLPSALSVREVVRNQTEGGFERLWPTGVEDAAIQREKEPLVGVDDEGIGTFTAGEDPLHAWLNGGTAPIGGIHMQPQT